MTKHRRESCSSELELATADGEPAYKLVKHRRSAKQRFEDKPPKDEDPETRNKSTENKERAYVAASRRTDRSIEARLASARRASEIHEERTGKALVVSESIVFNDEMYEEDDTSMPERYERLLLSSAAMPGATLPRRRGSHARPGPRASDRSPNWNTDIDKLFAQCFPAAEASLRRRSSDVLPLSPQAEAAQAHSHAKVPGLPSDREPASGSGLYQPQQQQQLEIAMADSTLQEISMQTSMSPPPESLPSYFPALGLETGFPPPVSGSQDLSGTSVLNSWKLPTPPEEADTALNACAVTTTPAAAAAAHCLTLDLAALDSATAAALNGDMCLPQIVADLRGNLPGLSQEEAALDSWSRLTTHT